MVSTENSMYGSQYSIYITKGFAVMRFSIIYWRSAACEHYLFFCAELM